MANLSKTSFGSSPSTGTEVVDAYSSGKLDSLIQSGDIAAAATAVDELYPGVNAEKTLEFLSDEDTQAFLADNGLSLSDAYKNIDNNTPSKVDKNDLLDSGSLSDLYAHSNGLKATLPKDVYDNMDSATYKKFLAKAGDYTASYGSYDAAGNNDTLRQWGTAAGILGRGTDTWQTVYNAACKSGIAEELALAGGGEEIITWIYDDDTLPEEMKLKIITDLAATAGQANNWTLLDAILEKAAGRFTVTQIQETIQSILQGYRLASDDRHDLEAAATALINRLDLLDSSWDKTARAGETLGWMHYLRYATAGALKVLCYHTRTDAIAYMYKGFRPQLRNFDYYYDKYFLS